MSSATIPFIARIAKPPQNSPSTGKSHPNSIAENQIWKNQMPTIITMYITPLAATLLSALKVPLR